MSKQLSSHQSSKSETDVDKTVIENKNENSDFAENKFAGNSQCEKINDELIKKVNYELYQKMVNC